MLCILSKKDYTQSKRLGKLLHVSILINFVLLKLARRMSDSVKISCKVKVRELEYWPKIRVYKTQWESKETTAFKRHHSYINIILLRLIKLIHIWYMALEGASSHMQNTRLHLTETKWKKARSEVRQTQSLKFPEKAGVSQEKPQPIIDSCFKPTTLGWETNASSPTPYCCPPLTCLTWTAKSILPSSSTIWNPEKTVRTKTLPSYLENRKCEWQAPESFTPYFSRV